MQKDIPRWTLGAVYGLKAPGVSQRLPRGLYRQQLTIVLSCVHVLFCAWLALRVMRTSRYVQQWVLAILLYSQAWVVPQGGVP